MELLDGSIGASGCGACECLTGTNLAGRGRRRRPCSRARRLQGFLTLWKDADPDIPIYKQAKAEYAKLQ